MGYNRPPLPPMPDELERRWNAGARTLEELDPDLYRWNQERRRQLRRQIATLIVGMLGAATVFVICLIVSLVARGTSQ